MVRVLAAAAALLASASAAPALVTWYEFEQCQDAHRTIVSLETDLCQTVPQSTTGGYRVTCNEDGLGGTFEVCANNQCGQCSVAVPFQNNQCLPNPAQYGSRSVTIDCSAAVVPPVTPAIGDSLIRWFEEPTCGGPHETVVVAPQDLCHLVPNSQTMGYKVTCSAAGGGGNFQVCEDVNCQNCNITTPFQSNQCLPNPIEFGSASVSFQCGAPPVVPGGGGGGAGNNTASGQVMAITWFEFESCRDDHRTIVVAPDNLCHTVPNSTVAGYLPICNADRTGGQILFCGDNRCSTNCTIGQTFTNDQCMPNDPVYGSASLSATCGEVSTNTITPRTGDFLAEWHENEGCNGPERTLVLGPQNFCHVVPNATLAGYKVTCNADGTAGTFSVCEERTCGTCGSPSPFGNGQCLPNPPVFGSKSVRFWCSVPAGGVPGSSSAPGAGNSTTGQDGALSSSVAGVILGAAVGAAALML